MLLRSGRLAEKQKGAEGQAHPSVPLQAIQKLTLAEQPKRDAHKRGHGRQMAAGAAAAATAGTVAALSTSAAAASSSSSSSSAVATISPPLRLPLALMPFTEVAASRVVDTDNGPLRLLRVHADPLIVRVPSFLAPSEIRTLLDAVTAESPIATTSNGGDSSSSASAASAAALPSQWERYKPYHAALGCDAVSDIATMSKRELRCMPSLYPLLDTIAARVARVCQANVTCISSLKEVLRYEPGQAFLLHKDDKEDTSGHVRGWRLLTALIYLQLEHPKEKGGGTIFPLLPGSGSYRSAAEAGTLLLFRNVRPNSGQLDARTAHRAEPTTLGRKFVLQCYVTEKKGNDSHWD